MDTNCVVPESTVVTRWFICPLCGECMDIFVLMNHGWEKHNITAQLLDNYLTSANFYDSTDRENILEFPEFDEMANDPNNLQSKLYTDAYWEDIGEGVSKLISEVPSFQGHDMETYQYDSLTPAGNNPKLGYAEQSSKGIVANRHIDPALLASANLSPLPSTKRLQSSISNTGGEAVVSAPGLLPVQLYDKTQFIRATHFPRAPCDACYDHDHDCSFTSFGNGCQWCRRRGYACYVHIIPAARLWKAYDEQYPEKAASVRKVEEKMALL